MTGSRPGTASASAAATRFGRRIRQLEIALLTVIFVAIVVLGLAQIGLRNIAGVALPWADPAMRAGVLWITMLAAVLGAGQARHIRIDALTRYLPDRLRPWVLRAMHLGTALVCVTLAAASIELVRLEYSIGDTMFLSLPRWVVLAIIPVGFALMGWRFMRHAFLPGPPVRTGHGAPVSAGDG